MFRRAYLGAMGANQHVVVLKKLSSRCARLVSHSGDGNRWNEKEQRRVEDV